MHGRDTVFTTTMESMESGLVAWRVKRLYKVHVSRLNKELNLDSLDKFKF